MTSHHDEQKQRRELAGSTGAMTYHSRAIADLQLEQGQSGRFTQGAEVSGSKLAAVYPRMPEGSPWHSDIVFPEEPLGYSVEDLEPTGTPQEIAASLGHGEAAEASDEVSDPFPH
jgi:hypothetical protein